MRQESRRSASGVKEKYVGGQGEVCQGSRKSASGVKAKCFCWMCGNQLKHFALTPDALFLDPRQTSPWPPAHFFLTPDALFLDLEGLFYKVEKSKKKLWNKNPKLFLKMLYILKYSYPLVVAMSVCLKERIVNVENQDYVYEWSSHGKLEIEEKKKKTLYLSLRNLLCGPFSSSCWGLLSYWCILWSNRSLARKWQHWQWLATVLRIIKPMLWILSSSNNLSVTHLDTALACTHKMTNYRTMIVYFLNFY